MPLALVVAVEVAVVVDELVPLGVVAVGLVPVEVVAAEGRSIEVPQRRWLGPSPVVLLGIQPTPVSNPVWAQFLQSG